MEDISCYCGNTINLEMEDSSEFSSSKELLDSITNGTFQSVECPKCTNRINVEVIQYISIKDSNLKILFIPEIQRHSFLNKKLKTKKADLAAIGIKELNEVALILSNNLDIKLIEYIKYQFLRKAEKKELEIFVKSITNEEITFYIHGYAVDKVGVTKVNMEFYNNLIPEINKISKTSPFNEIFQTPYISLNKIYRD